MIRQQSKILKHLIHSDEYTRKVIPFLKEEYFDVDADRIIFKIIDDFVKEYNCNPSIEAVEVKLQEIKMDETQKSDADVILKEIAEYTEEENIQWLIDSTEKYCKDAAVYNGLRDSLAIVQGEDKNRSRDAIPQILQDALAVCFDSTIGHDYVEDFDKRFDFYHSDVQRIPFDIGMLNKITKNGLPNKSLNIFIAGCVHPDTKVRLRVEGVECDKTMKDVKYFIKNKKFVEIYSPDGFVKINKYIQKGLYQEYVLSLDDGRTVRCNENHLFETALGWQYAREIMILDTEQHFLTEEGYVMGFVHAVENSMIPIVDIEVDHENHRYYANGVSSHNTGVGKSIAMCHFAAAALMQKKNVLYITLEMSEERIAERIDANLLDVDINKIVDISRETFENKIENIQKKTSGKLIIKEYPTSTAHAGHFKHLLNELKIKKKFIPDLLIVDYLNICASQRYKSSSNVNSYNYYRGVAEELRALGVEFDIPVISAGQLNREGYGSSDPDMTDSSDSFGISFTADLIIAIVSNPDLEKLNQVILKQIKNRYNDVNYHNKFVVGIDRPKMRLFDTESSANKEIVHNRQEEVAKNIFNDLTNKNKSKFSNMKV